MSVLPKYQIFISSTFSDLREERERVTWEILKSGYIPVGMENFGAANDRGWKTITRVLDETDYYVLILAGRYGSVDPETGISWTEREYNYAVEKGIPVLAFLRDTARITMDKVDDQEAQKAFVSRIRKKLITDGWDTGEKLAGQVVSALHKQIKNDGQDEKPRPGWFRGSAPACLAGDFRREQDLAELRELFVCVPGKVITVHFDSASLGWFHASDTYFMDEFRALVGTAFHIHDSGLRSKIDAVATTWFAMLGSEYLHSRDGKTSFAKEVAHHGNYQSYVKDKAEWDEQVVQARAAYRDLVEFTRQEYPEVDMRELEKQALKNRAAAMTDPEVASDDQSTGAALDGCQLELLIAIGEDQEGLSKYGLHAKSHIPRIEIRIRLEQLISLHLIEAGKMQDENGVYEGFTATDAGMKWLERHLQRVRDFSPRPPTETGF